MFGHFNQAEIEAKGRALAEELRAQYEAGAVEVCRAALTRPGQSRERRRAIRLALQILMGAITPAASTARSPHLDPA